MSAFTAKLDIADVGVDVGVGVDVVDVDVVDVNVVNIDVVGRLAGI